MNVRIICKYDDSQDDTIDDIILKRMEEIGAVWYGQGFDFMTRERDICFDYDIHTPPNSPDGIGNRSAVEALSNLSRRVDNHFETMFHKDTTPWAELVEAKAILAKAKGEL